MGNRSTHIPYWDSKLTWLLQDSLEGNDKTIMVASLELASYWLQGDPLQPALCEPSQEYHEQALGAQRSQRHTAARILGGDYLPEVSSVEEGGAGKVALEEE